MTTIGDLLEEFKERPDPGADLPVLTLTERNGFVRQADRFNKRLATEDTSGYKVVRSDDIAFNPYLLWAGAVAQNTICAAGIISPLYPTFRVRPGNHPQYVARLLLTPQLIAAYDGIAFGSVPRRRRSSVADFLGLALAPQPTYDEQCRIAAILDKADALRAKRRRASDLRMALVQSAFERTLVGVDHEPVRFGELVTAIRNGLSPSTSGKVRASVLTLSAVTRGYFDASATKEGLFGEEPRDSVRVSASDFLICRGNGNRTLVGAGVHPDADRQDLVFPDTVIAATVDAELVDLTFLETAWRQRAVRNQVEAGARTTNGTFKVNQQVLSSIEVRLPPIKAQREFAARVDLIRQSRRMSDSGAAGIDELFASLQARAFSGEL